MIVNRRTVMITGAAVAVAHAVPATAAGSPLFFPGFGALDVEAGGVRFAGVIGGSGPPLLLLH